MTKPNDPGPKPELKWIDIGELYVDSEYQRNAKSERSKRNLDYMRMNFSWAFCGALVVSYMQEKKQYAVIDGQHRYLVAKSLSTVDQLPCLVVSNLDVERQAKSFVAINTKRVQLNTLAAFHAAVAARDPEAVSVKEALDSCGMEIPSNPVMAGDTDPHQIQCVGTLASLRRRYSVEQIASVLKLVREAYGEKRGMMRSLLIKALMEIVAKTADLERPRLLKVLTAIKPIELEQDARAFVSVKGGTSVAAMVEVLERLYRNAGRKNAA